MAHLVDDYLMGTTHVIRADEWFASLPLHVQLFQMFGFTPPKYAHVAPFLTVDTTTGNKRKLSKRHDKEADLRWFFEKGIPPYAALTYIMNVIDPFFEERAAKNPDASYRDYVFDLTRMGQSGALFDLQKLFFVSKEALAKLDKEAFHHEAVTWAQQYGDASLVAQMEAQPAYTFAALNIERCSEQDPKRYRMFSDIADQLPAFYDALYDAMPMPALPESLADSVRMSAFLDEYLPALDLTGGKEAWFAQLKEVGGKHGFAASNGDFKQYGPGGSALTEGEAPHFVGKIGDLAMFLRMKLLKSGTTPDLYESMGVMGKERVEKRLRG
jgi:glutamyl-tRNA synthetase